MWAQCHWLRSEQTYHKCDQKAMILLFMLRKHHKHSFSSTQIEFFFQTFNLLTEIILSIARNLTKKKLMSLFLTLNCYLWILLLLLGFLICFKWNIALKIAISSDFNVGFIKLNIFVKTKVVNILFKPDWISKSNKFF